MLLPNTRRYSFIRIPLSLNRSFKLTHKECKSKHAEFTNAAKPFANESLLESATKLDDIALEEKYKSLYAAYSLPVDSVRDVCSKWSVEETNHGLLPACAPLHRRPRFIQHYASVCVAHDPVMLLAFYLQAAGRYSDLLDVSSLHDQSLQFNRVTTSSSSSSSSSYMADASNERTENRNADKSINYYNCSEIVNVEHVTRIVQEMAACVGASISRNAWPPWVTHFFELREQQVLNPTADRSNKHSQLFHQESYTDLELIKLHDKRYRVGNTHEISKDHLFSPLVVEARGLLQTTTLEIVTCDKHKTVTMNKCEQSMKESDARANNVEKNSEQENTRDILVFDILRMYAALCAICIAPSRTEAVSLARNVLAKCRHAVALVGLALRTFCFANKSWYNEEDEEYNENANNDNKSYLPTLVEELWLQVWEEINCRDQDVLDEKCVESESNKNDRIIKNINSKTQLVSNTERPVKAELRTPFIKFVHEMIGLDVETIEYEYLHWHIHCLLCVKPQMRTLKLHTRTESALPNSHSELQEWEHVRMSSLTSLLTSKTEFALNHVRSNECVCTVDRLGVQGILELFTLAPVSWLHNNKMYHMAGEAVVLILESEYKMLIHEQHAEKLKQTECAAEKKRHISVFSTHVQLFVRTVNYLLYKVITSVSSLLAQHSAYHHIKRILQLFNVKAMLHALTINTNNSSSKISKEAVYDEYRCINLRELITALYNIITLVGFIHDKSTIRNTNDYHSESDDGNAEKKYYYKWHTVGKSIRESQHRQNHYNPCEIIYNEKNSDTSYVHSMIAAAAATVNDTITSKQIKSFDMLRSDKLNNDLIQHATHDSEKNMCMYSVKDEKQEIMVEENKCNTLELSEDNVQRLLQEKMRKEVIAHTVHVLCALLTATSATPSREHAHSKTRVPPLFNRISSDSTSRSHRYEFTLSELPHKVICLMLEELLTRNYTTEVVQLCSCIVAHDLIDLRYYNLPLIAKLCQTMEEEKSKCVNATHDTKANSLERADDANAFAKDNFVANSELLSLEKIERVYDALQKLYKRRREVFGETILTSSAKGNLSSRNSYSDKNSLSSELTDKDEVTSYKMHNYDDQRDHFNAQRVKSEFSISAQTPTLLSPLTQWGLATNQAGIALLQSENAQNAVQEFDKSQTCLYARKVASLYQLHNEPQVVSLLHSLLTRVSPLLGGGFTIDRRPHYYNFGE